MNRDSSVKSAPSRFLPGSLLGSSLIWVGVFSACTSAYLPGEEQGAAVDGLGASVSGGIHAQVLVVDQVEREFSFFVPDDSKDKGDGALPIVLYLHGHGDNKRHILGRGLAASASSVWMDVAQREGFLVLYPLGAKGGGLRSKTGWNDCRPDAKGNPGTDDVEFVRAMIEFAVEELGGDRSRVYVTGMSNGGHMTMRVAMEMSEEVAAVAPIAALMPRSNACRPPSIPVPILLMHGTADPLAPFEGGAMAGGRGEVRSARDTVEAWTAWNQLEDVPVVVTELPDLDPEDESTIVVSTRERSPQGVAVVAYQMRGAGHTEPSVAAPMGRLLSRIQGNQNHDVEMAEVVWEFFRSRSR